MTQDDFLRKWGRGRPPDCMPRELVADLAAVVAQAVAERIRVMTAEEFAKRRLRRVEALACAEAQREACAKVVGVHLMPFAIAPVAVSSVRSTPLVTQKSSTTPTESSLTQPKTDSGDR